MISYLGPLGDLTDLEIGCALDPVLGSRVCTYAHCYGARFLFCDIWVIYGEERQVLGAISRYNGTMTIAACDRVNVEELALFCLSSAAVEFEADLRLLARMEPYFPLEEIRRREESAEMTWGGGPLPDEPLHPVEKGKRLGKVHEILCQCFEDFQNYSPYTAWYVDVSARIRRGICQIWNVLEQGKPVATAGVYYYQKGSGVIACVGTLPEKRGQGYGATAVLTCVRALLEQGDMPYLTTASDELVKFYSRLGFVVCGRRGAIHIR